MSFALERSAAAEGEAEGGLLLRVGACGKVQAHSAEGQAEGEAALVVAAGLF